MPMNLIGTPVTCLTESAAPPRASPSSFVMMTPSSSSFSLNTFALLTASWPVMPSTTRYTCCGTTWRSIRSSSPINSSSMCSRPAVSRITTSAPRFFASRTAALRNRDRILVRAIRVNRNLELLAEHVQLVDSRRALQVARHEQRLAARAASASGRACRSIVVLPEPCRPHIISTVTSSVPLQVQRMIHRPHQVDELLIDDADDLLARIERLENLLADRLLGDVLHELPHDREAHIRLEQRLLDELQPVAHVRFGELPLAAQRLQRGTQAILQGFKHGESAMSIKIAAN